ncbi:rho guanine nucleotide exchange factor 26 isoform X1 [Ornithorhynchus anatinus]|uniref:rho guanine nucleotide exchange factor 26 isoform X1 n=1 Tax=Ornithorhynchus anatinus TaxID=9258 RepID=UPI0019D4655C|nr:rho guanine nucleotide exchange factor 26 isoform X1 [Ornithorhynchus anatinus]
MDEESPLELPAPAGTPLWKRRSSPLPVLPALPALPAPPARTKARPRSCQSPGGDLVTPGSPPLQPPARIGGSPPPWHCPGRSLPNGGPAGVCGVQRVGGPGREPANPLLAPSPPAPRAPAGFIPTPAASPTRLTPPQPGWTAQDPEGGSPAPSSPSPGSRPPLQSGRPAQGPQRGSPALSSPPLGPSPPLRPGRTAQSPERGSPALSSPPLGPRPPLRPGRTAQEPERGAPALSSPLPGSGRSPQPGQTARYPDRRSPVPSSSPPRPRPSSQPGRTTQAPERGSPVPSSPPPGPRPPSRAGQPTQGPERGSPALASPPPGPRPPLQRLPPSPLQGPEKPVVILSTNSPAALKVGKQQIIPRGLASEIKLTGKATGPSLEPHKRVLKVRSLVDSVPAPDGDREVEEEVDSPGSLRRGLRSTSYRRAVVSGLDFDSPTNSKKKNRMSQPILKAVVEDREKFSSLGRIKKKILKGQGTFDGEENAVLYQNYKEKALDIDSDEDSEPKEQKSNEKIIIHYKPLRSTWSQLSVVKRNGLSQTISQEERKRQEAMFEVISSEHSYLLSLEILIRMFKNSKELSDTMTKTESHHLFSNIADVCEASQKFFKELEERHQNNILIDDISDIVEKHTSSTFDPYVKYCTNEVYQQRTLQKLIATNPSFKEVLSRIESQEECGNLPMISFLILPMQRVTRLPLLMDTICQKTPKDSPQYEVCKRALKEVSKLVRLCNEGARKMERTEMMYTINSQLEFKIKPFPLVSSSRWLVKRGELTAYVEDTVLFSRRTSKQQVYFFLFNDVLIITKKKSFRSRTSLDRMTKPYSEESYNVTDYSLRDQLVVEQYEVEEPSSSPVKNSTPILYSRQNPAGHLFTLTVLSNHANERTELLLGTETQNERARWITALGHSSDRQDTDRTTLTQVEIIRTYTAKQPDELSLQMADVVLVYQRVSDGWYEGERLRDGERGWFPTECAKEITCRATIDKNMERMGRLLGLETNV